MKKRFCATALLVSACTTAAPPPSGRTFDYIDARGARVETTHALRTTLEVPRRFRLIGETAHTPVFDGVRFNVSLVAYADGDEFVMIHAEQHADGSGGLDYSHLEPVTLNGRVFHARTQCAELSQEDVREEHDLAFLLAGGFDPAPAVYLRQYFATSPGGAAEVVLTWGKRLTRCDQAQADAFSARAAETFASVVTAF